MNLRGSRSDKAEWRNGSGLRVGVYRHSVAVFLAALVIFIIAMPFAEMFADPGFLEGVLLTLVMLCGVLAVGARRYIFFLAALLSLIGLGAKWIHHFRPELVAPGIYLGIAVLLLVVVAIQLFRFILREPRVNAEVLSAGIAIYLVLGLIWGLAYLFAASVVPNAFVLGGDASKALDGFHALYFSFVTLTTIGYGDVVPAVPVVRMLAVLEGVTGVLYLSILIARLVTLYTDK